MKYDACSLSPAEKEQKYGKILNALKLKMSQFNLNIAEST